MNFVLIMSYVEEIAQAGPDAMTLVKDVIRAINDLRAGKVTQDEFSTVINDLMKIAADAVGIGGQIKGTSTVSVTSTTTK